MGFDQENIDKIRRTQSRTAEEDAAGNGSKI